MTANPIPARRRLWMPGSPHEPEDVIRAALRRVATVRSGRLVEWEISGHRLRPAGSKRPLGPFVDSPTVPGGVTVTESRHARLPRMKSASLRLLRWLACARERRTDLGPALFFLGPHQTATAPGACRDMSTIELQEHPYRLEAESVVASLEELASDTSYIADLDEEIGDTKAAYVSAAVTEIALLRPELWGPQRG